MTNLNQFCTENYGTPGRLSHVEAFVRKRLSEKAALARPVRPSISVLGQGHPGISKPHGFSPKELRIASEAAHYIEGLGHPLWYAVLADQRREERELRALARELKSDVIQAQREAGSPPFWLEMCEGRPAFHSNLFFPLGGPKPERLIARISRSILYPGDLLYIQPAERAEWFIGYCSKERTPQAKYLGGIKMHRRLIGSHRLGKGGGDRMRLSKALKADLIVEGKIEPYRQIYASRALSAAEYSGISKPPHRMAKATLQPVESIRDPDPHGLFGPLPEVVAPSRDHVLPPRQRFKLILPEQAELALERLPDAIDLMARLGSTHAEIAEKIGRSRAQITNILNRQFGASRPVTRRVLELALAA